MPHEDEGNLETFVQSFIVRIWLEGPARETGQTAWRGHITHVPSGEQRYLRDLDDIPAFIKVHLRDMGVTLGLH